MGIEPKMIAAGDDVCCFIKKDLVDKFVWHVRLMTHDKNEPIIKGIG